MSDIFLSHLQGCLGGVPRPVVGGGNVALGWGEEFGAGGNGGGRVFRRGMLSLVRKGRILRSVATADAGIGQRQRLHSIIEGQRTVRQFRGVIFFLVETEGVLHGSQLPVCFVHHGLVAPHTPQPAGSRVQRFAVVGLVVQRELRAVCHVNERARREGRGGVSERDASSVADSIV